MHKANQREGLDFIQHVHQVGSLWIRERLRQMPKDKGDAIKRMAIKTLRSIDLKKEEELRDGAVRLIVASLPDTFPVLEQLLRDHTSPLWYEVHFTAFCSLERDHLTPSDQKRVLELIRDYLLNISSGAGHAAWKAGDLLGDEWRDSATLEILRELLISARHAAGRRAALHGIEHALNKASPAEARRLFSLVRKVAEEDRSAEVRRSAQLALQGVGCGPRAGK